MPELLKPSDIQRLLQPDVIRELAAGIPGFDRAGLLTAIIEAWGGQDALARDICLEFQHAGKGGMTRQRILDMICRMISQHSNDDRVKPVDEMDDAELRLAIVSMAGEIDRVGVTVRTDDDEPGSRRPVQRAEVAADFEEW